MTDALLLTPSRGSTGGIARVAESLQQCWEGRIRRVGLSGPSPPGKLAFGLHACTAAARHRPDIVLCLHAGLLPVAAAAAAAGNARLALFGMGREVWGPMRRPRRELVRRCSRVLAISPFTAEWLARRAGLAPETVAVVLLPVAERFAHAAESEAGPRAETQALRLLTVSRITAECRYKGHFAVARAIEQLVRDGREVRWTVVGEGDDLPVLRRTCDELGLAGSVELLGRVNDAELEHRYRDADVLVLPSAADPEAEPPVGEGFGLVYAEAGAYGIPSIAATTGGGSSAFVVDGETGLTVDPSSVGDLTSAIARLQEDTALRERLGERARRRVLTHHLPRHFGADLHEALG